MNGILFTPFDTKGGLNNEFRANLNVNFFIPIIIVFKFLNSILSSSYNYFLWVNFYDFITPFESLYIIIRDLVITNLMGYARYNGGDISRERQTDKEMEKEQETQQRQSHIEIERERQRERGTERTRNERKRDREIQTQT